MIYPKGDIGVYRKRDIISPSGKRLNHCEWRRALLFKCVYTQMQSDDLKERKETEVNSEKRIFILDSYQQLEKMPWDIMKTDYVGYQEDGDTNQFVFWYKIMALKFVNIRGGCCRLTIYTERIEPRECRKVGLSCTLKVLEPQLI